MSTEKHIWTNGYGQTGPKVFEGQVITEATALAWLKEHYDGAEK